MEMYVRGNNGVLEDIDRFDDTSQTCGGFKMANLQVRQPSD